MSAAETHSRVSGSREDFMRNLILAITAVAMLGVSAAAVEAMPSVDTAGLAAAPVQYVEKTVVVVTRGGVRPVRTVCTVRRGPMGRVTKVCRTIR